MKVVTQGFKDAIRTFGRELDTIVTIGEQTFDKESLNGITPTFNSGLFCTIMKGVEIDLNVFTPKNSIINIKSGVLVNDTYEYIDYGNYKTKDDSQIDEDTSSYKVIAYDKILESMVDYDLGINYPISVRDYWVAIFNELGWDISGIPTTFRNSTKMINQDVHSGIGYTYRDVLDELCKISFVWLVDKNGIPTILEPTETGENIDETYLSDTNVTIKQKVFFNSLVFSRAEESDNIYRKDDESILLNGLHEFRIADNQLLSTNDRDLYIDELWEYLKTFTYYSFEVDTIGIMFLEPLDAFNLVANGNTYPTILLNDETQITQGLKEILYSDEPEESQTEYKYADSTDKKINQAYIVVDKQNQTITSLTSNISQIQNEIDSNYYTIEKVNELIQNAETGLTNTFLRSGGNNLLRNTAPYFMTSENEAEFWEGKVKQIKEVNSISGFALLLQSGTLSQTIDLAPNQYAIKFSYKRLLLSATATVKYNGRTIELDEEGTIETTGTVNSGKFEFRVDCNIDDGYEIYDLMLNVGEVAGVWTQNANESTSDTVNISKGITVSSNTTNTDAKMDSDGFRVINKSTGESVMEGTDEGGKFKKVEAEKGTIGGVITQKVGNQSWISGV